MLEELCKRIQHCCATLRRSRNKRNVGSCWLKNLTGSYATQQHPTTCNKVCKRTQHVTSNNVGSVCTGLNIHFRVIQVVKEKHSMTFSHFHITFQLAGIYISPVMLGNRRAKAHLLPGEQKPSDLSR